MTNIKEKKTPKEKKRTTRIAKDRKVKSVDEIMLEIQNLVKNPSKNIMENEFKLKGLEKLATLKLKKEQMDMLKGSGNGELKEIKLTVVDSKNESAEERIKKLEQQIIEESKND